MQVLVLAFADNFPPAAGRTAEQVFALTVAAAGLVSFALVLALVEQVRPPHHACAQSVLHLCVAQSGAGCTVQQSAAAPSTAQHTCWASQAGFEPSDGKFVPPFAEILVQFDPNSAYSYCKILVFAYFGPILSKNTTSAYMYSYPHITYSRITYCHHWFERIPQTKPHVLKHPWCRAQDTDDDDP